MLTEHINILGWVGIQSSYPNSATMPDDGFDDSSVGKSN